MKVPWTVVAGATATGLAGLGILLWLGGPQRKPVSLGWKVAGAMGLTVGTGLVVYRVVHGPQRLRAPKFLRGDKGLRGIYDGGATVDEEVLKQLHSEIDDEALAKRVVDLSPKAQLQAYDLSRRLWVENDFEGDKSALVRRVLSSIAPQTSWHVPRVDLPDDSDRAKVWDGVMVVVDIMGASAEEEAREYEGGSAAGGAS